VHRGADIIAVEAKSGSTVASDAFDPLSRIATLVPEIAEQIVIHGGADAWSLRSARAVPYLALDPVETSMWLLARGSGPAQQKWQSTSSGLLSATAGISRILIEATSDNGRPLLAVRAWAK
jgi:hypothetical protein